jgi:hypothetical protein
MLSTLMARGLFETSQFAISSRRHPHINRGPKRARRFSNSIVIAQFDPNVRVPRALIQYPTRSVRQIPPISRWLIGTVAT